MKYIYLCDDSIDGIFTAIYDAWADGHGHSSNEIQVHIPGYNRQLFSEYIEVTSDLEKAKKVAATLSKKVSPAFYEWITQGASSCDLKKADVIYRVIILGLHMGQKVMQHFGNDFVCQLFALTRTVGNEAHHYKEFLRFEELKNGLLFSKINPKNDILYFLAPHFCDRFPDEDFIIADVRRRFLLIHTKGKPPAFRTMPEVDFEHLILKYSAEEQLLQDLFKTFVKSVMIEERKNLKLQRQMLPLYFREYMNEFHHPLP